MCWKSNCRPVLRTAEKPIITKKLVRVDGNYMYSPLFMFPWTTNRVASSSIGKIYMNSNENYSIEEGLHSASHIEILHYEHSSAAIFGGGMLLLSPVYHYKIVEAIIPKGARYYVNIHGEYVSNKLIITNKSVSDVLV